MPADNDHDPIPRTSGPEDHAPATRAALPAIGQLRRQVDLADAVHGLELPSVRGRLMSLNQILGALCVKDVGVEENSLA